MARPVLLDTCAAIWLMNGDPISKESRAAVTAAQTENQGVFVSPMTAWEIATLAAKNRLQLTLAPEAWFNNLLRLPGATRSDAAQSADRLGGLARNAAQRPSRPDYRGDQPGLRVFADDPKR